MVLVEMITNIVKRESWSRSGQDKNRYFNTKVRTFLEREDILLGPHSLQGWGLRWRLGAKKSTMSHKQNYNDVQFGGLWK